MFDEILGGIGNLGKNAAETDRQITGTINFSRKFKGPAQERINLENTS